jgi:hypothetical protein
MRLIDNWKDAGRLWSVRLSAAGALLLTLLLAFPDVALTAWNAMPDDMRVLLPEQTSRMISIALFVATIVARVVRQRRGADGKSGQSHAE